MQPDNLEDMPRVMSTPVGPASSFTADVRDPVLDDTSPHIVHLGWWPLQELGACVYRLESSQAVLVGSPARRGWVGEGQPHQAHSGKSTVEILVAAAAGKR